MGKVTIRGSTSVSQMAAFPRTRKEEGLEFDRGEKGASEMVERKEGREEEKRKKSSPIVGILRLLASRMM